MQSLNITKYVLLQPTAYLGSRVNRVNKDSTTVAPVAEEQPHHGKEEEKARSGSCDDDKNKEGQAGGQHVGSQSFMQRVSICTIRLKSYGAGIAIWTTSRCNNNNNNYYAFQLMMS